MTNGEIKKLCEAFDKHISQLSNEEFEKVLKEYEKGDIAKLLMRANAQLFTEPVIQPDQCPDGQEGTN